MFDMHIHTKNSLDSRQTVDEVCLRAIECGLQGIAICDHVDIIYGVERNTYEKIRACVSEVIDAREKYGDRIKILQGIELAETKYDPALAKKIMELTDYDVILLSVHTLYCDGVEEPYSCVDWGKLTMEQIKAFFAHYLDELARVIAKNDFDVLCHLTCPLRYINGKFNRGLDLREFSDRIDELLSAIIQKEIVLEVNTSGRGTPFGEWLPNEEILSRYFAMGGRLITLSSDAHVPQNIGNAFSETAQMLKAIGFSEACYYEKRKPKFVRL